tara:strand:+ start:1253 stop:1615 length:363 start_codon:yes stop_codon:yes gene_type:complete
MPRKGYAFLVTIQEASESISDEGYSTYTWANLGTDPTWWVSVEGQNATGGAGAGERVVGHKLEVVDTYVLTGPRRRDLQPAMRIQWVSSEKTHNLRVTSASHSEDGRDPVTIATCIETDE